MSNSLKEAAISRNSRNLVYSKGLMKPSATYSTPHSDDDVYVLTFLAKNHWKSLVCSVLTAPVNVCDCIACEMGVHQERRFLLLLLMPLKSRRLPGKTFRVQLLWMLVDMRNTHVSCRAHFIRPLIVFMSEMEELLVLDHGTKKVFSQLCGSCKIAKKAREVGVTKRVFLRKYYFHHIV